MRLHHIAAACALAATIAPAHATDYAFTFAGTQFHWISPYECSTCPPGVASPWVGTMLLTAPDGDGAYTWADSVTVRLDDRTLMSPFQFTDPFIVTISGGRVTGFGGKADWSIGLQPEHYTFDGWALHWDAPATHHFGDTFGDAQIAAVVTHASEPESFALLLAGLAFVARIAWRRT